MTRGAAAIGSATPAAEDAYRGLIQRVWSENVLFSVLLELTYRCNLDCVFCYNDLGLEGRPLSRGQYQEMLEELAALGVMNLTLSGGEPLAHRDFFAIGSSARELGFVVRVKSNGHALGESLARRLRDEVDPFAVDLSLHGASSEVHDRQTRVPGSFERLLGNIGTLQRLGVRLKLNGTLTRWNEHQIADMFRLAERLGVTLQLSPTVTPRDDGDRSPLELAPSPGGVAELVRIRSEYSDRWTGASASSSCGGGGPAPVVPRIAGEGKNCAAGSSTLTVDPFGDVFPCVQWRTSLGNLHDSSIREIWEQSPGLARVREVTTRAFQMKRELGDVGRYFSFCPGLSNELSGDPLAVEPVALEHARITERVLGGETSSRSLPVIA